MKPWLHSWARHWAWRAGPGGTALCGAGDCREARPAAAARHGLSGLQPIAARVPCPKRFRLGKSGALWWQLSLVL